jgi:hypothetical protein
VTHVVLLEADISPRCHIDELMLASMRYSSAPSSSRGRLTIMASVETQALVPNALVRAVCRQFANNQEKHKNTPFEPSADCVS